MLLVLGYVVQVYVICKIIIKLGFYCPPGSTSKFQIKCPFGKYGGTAGLSSAACSGNCSAGYFCYSGSSTATQHACPAGSFGISGGATSSKVCSGLCSIGFHVLFYHFYVRLLLSKRFNITDTVSMSSRFYFLIFLKLCR